MRSVLLIIGATLVLFGCDPENSSDFDTHIAPEAMLVDVRTAEEFASGHFPGAVNIPYDQIVEGLSARSVPADTPLVLYCRSGNRSGKALNTLQTAGFSLAQNAGDLQTLLAVHQKTLVIPTQGVP